MKKLILTVLVTIASLSVYAGPRIVGNGGLAIEENGKLYMLDLYERSIHRAPYYNLEVKPYQHVQQSMTKIFSMADLDRVPVDLLIQKMSEVYAKNYDLGQSLEKALKKIDWRLVDSQLSPSEDARSPIDGMVFRQVAIRLKNIVFISRPLWEKMDANNKVALLLHEAAYFFTPPTHVDTKDEKYSFQNALAARTLTGLLFTKRFAIEGPTYENSGMHFRKSAFLRDAQTALHQINVALFTSDSRYLAGIRHRNSEETDINDYKSLRELESDYTKLFRTRCEDIREYIQKNSSTSTIKAILGSGIYERISTETFNEYLLKNGTKQAYLAVDWKLSPKQDSREISLSRKDFTTDCTTYLTQKLKEVLAPYTWQLQ